MTEYSRHAPAAPLFSAPDPQKSYLLTHPRALDLTVLAGSQRQLG